MKKLILENFRCFRTRQEVPLAPLTLLVGENSTGKSSFLAATRIAWSIGHRGQISGFNEEPFPLGTYEQIANYRGGRAGRAKFFVIGYEDSVQVKKTSEQITLIAHFCQQNVQPELYEWFLLTKDYKVNVTRLPLESEINFRVETLKGSISWSDKSLFKESIPLELLAGYVSNRIFDKRRNNPDDPTAKLLEKELEQVYILLTRLSSSFSNQPYAIAPIRTKPKRTYDPVQDTPQPEGTHVPMVLARIVSSDSKQWLMLKRSLEDFGKACGLFEEIEVKKLGNSDSSPFQIRLKIVGPATNLVDVGYGVSQIIPILVDSFRSANNQIILLQQPEVHLHPRAQAELGTFLANLVKHDKKQFIVETHSDYLVDRVCMDVRDGKTLKPEDVMILFFERTDSEVVIHPIQIDENGNIQNAPASYRSFFLKEEQRYLGL